MVQLGVNGLCKHETHNDTNTDIVDNKQYGLTSIIVFELTEGQSLTKIVKHYKRAEGRLLLTFFLGFYVSFLLARWWQQVSALPKLDSLLLALHSHIHLTQSGRNHGDKFKNNYW